jgi:DNA mismatch endonuclease (patch repair protein)
MQANKRKDTKPELAVRRLVHQMGLRYRVDHQPLVGIRRRADLVFPRLKLAVFIDGCFWHGCPAHYVPSKTNDAYWAAKVTGNRKRDRDTDELLWAEGWTVLRIWEHESAVDAADRILEHVLAARTEHQT